MSLPIEELMKNAGVTALTDLQQEMLQRYPSGKDFILVSPTGSGKTLACLLPVLHHQPVQRGQVQTLVIAPSRELAQQIQRVARQAMPGLATVMCYGGHDIQKEAQQLSEGSSWIVGTPGRLADLLRRGMLDLSQCEVLILDEYDKCLELGFEEDLRLLFSSTKALHKKILCSATPLSNQPWMLKEKEPILLDYSQEKDSRPVHEYFELSLAHAKGNALHARFRCREGEQWIFFTNTRESADFWTEELKAQGWQVLAYHGGLDQSKRERNWFMFRNGSIHAIVTTDLGARGLDVAGVTGIVHLELPLREEEFIHRNGRTARWQQKGMVLRTTMPDMQEDPSYVSHYTWKAYPREAHTPLQAPVWTTLFVGKGKKDKVGKIDLLGFLCKIGKLEASEVGLMEIKELYSYVAVRRDKVKMALSNTHQQALKGSKTRIEPVDTER
ncbi:MAG: DEAD/DEAH box helicase [Cytophagaceae bacterium]|jgi:superfamily II DNA/RNA helicase|nr:DEAD/DEAH box helicase [Cytophagaceae bacterium]